MVERTVATHRSTQRDVLTAMEFCEPTGIIFVDDYTNADWPVYQKA